MFLHKENAMKRASTYISKNPFKNNFNTKSDKKYTP